MEKVIFINGKDTSDVNFNLREGYKVKKIIPIFQHVSAGGHYGESRGLFGAYAILTNDENDIKNNEY